MLSHHCQWQCAMHYLKTLRVEANDHDAYAIGHCVCSQTFTGFSSVASKAASLVFSKYRKHQREDQNNGQAVHP